jgi:hypothetical protein
MTQSQTADDAEDEVFLRRLHPTTVWVNGYRWFSSPNVLPIERYRDRPKAQGSA